ncbi:unnamed protein product [Mytilus coruscus]|uniref:Kringle domain-containing protein n=1 Tax=Mytilus coruscus TaxID=42192 RepID=A0A6J8EKU6_MYTCO|nr:unnamed protein product [Mytilus coruscus]
MASMSQRASKDVSCYNKYDKGATYSGAARTAIYEGKNKTCKNWKTYHSNYTSFYPDHNYCRNPKEKEILKPWCYTGPDHQFGLCNIPVCGCRNSINDLKYNGSISTTRFGNTCLRWENAKNYRGQTENYCRTPPNDADNAGGPWCYISRDGWNRCNIPVCEGRI